MPRMFDMLRPRRNDDNDKKKGPVRKDLPEDKPVIFPREIIKNNSGKKRKKEDHFLASKKLISEIKARGVDNEETARKIYRETVETVKGLLKKIKNGEDLNLCMDRVYTVLDTIFNQLLLGDNLLNDLYQEREEGYFLPYHIANIVILASYLGIHAGFNKSRLKILGLASLFCDLGMDAAKEIITQPRHLSDAERDIIKAHISKSREAAEKIGSIDDIVKETIMMHHERMDGSGYPDGLKSHQVNAYAKIIGLVDAYEAMTHYRPHREGMHAHKTIRFIIDVLKNYFDSDVVKLLINKMSIYPIGSIVRLDTDEVAKVVAAKPGSPLRPVIMIIKDSFGKPVQEKKMIIDLSKEDSPNIIEPI